MNKTSFGTASLVVTIVVLGASHAALAIPTGYNLVPLNTGTVTFVAGTNDGDGAKGPPRWREYR